ncbi:AMP-binding protein [Janthinobacterium sp. NKUCC08_JDC]|uniref:AMP-binding protein n=1 Tax=Janthinobacterium sp. NKUCC08_JDC TaxID=2842122 RepID=UPI001C5B03FE|nr:AMP-binding protein [Janthinobacterium sp. NKUCC08_JDC]MBW3497629.1 AMP-binding protein [Janthinobacterium sp. NKUCC08_JDC]
MPESSLPQAPVPDAHPPISPLARLALSMHGRPPAMPVGWRDGAVLDHAHFAARMSAWAGLLEGQAGRHFALYLDDSIEFGAALLGAWQAGKTVWLTADTLPASCASLAASVDGFLGQFPAAHAPLPLPADSLAERAWTQLADDFPALVVYTSGSTGAAQAIPKKLSQLASEVATLERLFGEHADGAAVVATVSHQHIYGLLFKVLWPLAAGRAVHAHSVDYPEQLAALLARGPCVLAASPAHLKRLPQHIDWSGARAQLRAVFSSGGPLALDSALAAGHLLGRVPREIYGSSETGGVAWRQRVPEHPDDESWQGFPGVNWRLMDDGALEVRSAHLADDGWLCLADRARVTAPGRFQLLGRSDRIVKIEEKRISLNAIEAALLATPLVLDARVLLCDAPAGERQKVAAFIVCSAAGRALLDAEGKLALNRQLQTALGGEVDAVAVPRRWRYLEQLPINAQGKTTQALLLALLEKPRLPHARLIERSAEGETPRLLFELHVPANLFYFEGHFTGAPLLPGVVQVEWALHFARQHLDLPARFRAMHALKFQQPVLPDRPVRLALEYDAPKASLQFRYLSDAGQHASGRILFHPNAAAVPDGGADTPTPAASAC